MNQIFPNIFILMVKLLNLRKYLRCIISDDGKDNKDISRLMRSVYFRGNVVINKFYMCSTDVKLKLFKSYCNSFYGLVTWSVYDDIVFHKLNVAFKRIFRGLFQIPIIDTSTTAYMLKYGIDPLSVVNRKLLHNFYKRFSSSSNTIVNSIYNHMLNNESAYLTRYFNSVYFNQTYL